MQIDLKGRINNTKLPCTGCLMPLFEAIANSIHAIEDAGGKGTIHVFIERDKSPRSLKVDNASLAVNPIRNFVVQDDGLGFTEKNFEAFLTCDTRQKASRGGKGVGRFLWLKAFDKAVIESNYQECGKSWRRQFEFALTERGVDKESKKESDASERTTAVKLIGFKPEYEKCSPRGADKIARRIVDHCLEYFVLDACPAIMVHDAQTGECVDLQYLFKSEIQIRSHSSAFAVKGKDFRARHVMVTSGQDNQHRLFFCADRRTVKSEPLAGKIANLLATFKDDADGRSAVYAGYVSGDFLDEMVNSERTDFSVPDQLEMDFPSDLSWQELLQAAVGQASEFLAPYTSPIKKSKEEQIEEFVRYEAPQYRALVKHKREWLDQIPPNLPKEKLDVELYRIDRKYGEELKEQSHKLLESLKEDEQKEYEEYRDVFAKFIEEWNERGMSQLAQYVTHRRTTLAFLDKRLQVRDDGKYPLEDSVHKLIFPLRETSDDVRPEKMNLWIINETLAYHYYLASDKKFKQIEPVDVSSQNRPDLLIFNRPFAFTDSSPTFGSIVLVEFKRPAREDFDNEENPIAQVYGYVREMKEGGAKDRHGRPISVPQHTPFYAYIICDITPRLRTQAENFQLTKTPDTLGYFGFNTNLGVYVEIMSFDKLVGDAKKRNAILFEKLGLGL